MGFLVKILLFYLAFRLIWSFFSKGNRIKNSRGKREGDEPIKRYNTQGEVIEDADFEDVP